MADDGMVVKDCARCNGQRWHNPLRKAKSSDQTQYRCTGCGYPVRSGGNSKNMGVKVGGRIVFLGPGQPAGGH